MHCNNLKEKHIELFTVNSWYLSPQNHFGKRDEFSSLDCSSTLGIFYFFGGGEGIFLVFKESI